MQGRRMGRGKREEGGAGCLPGVEGGGACPTSMPSFYSSKSRRTLWPTLAFPKPHLIASVQISCSVAQSCPILCDPMKRSIPGLPVHHQLPEFTQTHVRRIGDAIQPSHPLSSPSPPPLNLSQHQGLFKRVSSSHQVAEVLEFQLQQGQ